MFYPFKFPLYGWVQMLVILKIEEFKDNVDRLVRMSFMPLVRILENIQEVQYSTGQI